MRIAFWKSAPEKERYDLRASGQSPPKRSPDAITPGAAALREDIGRRGEAQARFNTIRAARKTGVLRELEESTPGPTDLGEPDFDFDPGELLARDLDWRVTILYQTPDHNLTRRPFLITRLYGEPPDNCGYVWGYCFLRRATRTLAVRRIKQIVVDDSHEEIDDADVEWWLPRRAGLRRD